MSEELKPCPCGGLVYVGSYKFIDATLSGIGCMHCGRTTGMTEAKPEAIAAWNRRASPTPPTTDGRWKYALEAAARIYGDAQDPARARQALPNDGIRVARALLSSPRVEDVRREALENIVDAIWSGEDGELYESLMADIGGWQPIETAPRDGTRVLVTWNHKGAGRHHVCVGRFDLPTAHAKKRSWCGDGDKTWHNELIRPTHWMPLPQPPEADK